MQKKISIIIDTNWWISLILSKYKTPLAELFKKKRFIVYRSKELTNEICETLLKEKFRSIIPGEVFNDFFKRYDASTRLVIVTSVVSACRDPKDDFLLSLAKDAKADFLITGDKDLLVLKNFENTKIVTLPELLTHINTIT